jgi:hypothetical protein
MSRNSQAPKVKAPSNVLGDSRNGAFQWLILLGVALGVITAIRFFWIHTS